MRDDKKTITLDFFFRYPAAGQYAEANTITVVEPGFEHRQVFYKMQAYVAAVRDKTQWSLLKNLKPEQIEAIQGRTGEVAPGAAAEAPIALGLDWFADLGIDEYANFQVWLQKALTGNRSLAYVGSERDLEVKDRVPVTEEVWMNIVAIGGLGALNKVLAGFTSFFTDIPAAQASPTKPGTGSSASSAVVPLASSQSTPPARRRSQG